MKKRIILIPVILLMVQNIVLAQSSSSASPYCFTLRKAAVTSAGVYRASDSVLIRTLWTLVKYNAGTYNIKWDGKDDSGAAAPAGNYVIHVTSNNVSYTWKGVIGNTSLVDTGATVHRGMYYFMTGMTISGTTAYYCSGYSEGKPSIYKFLTTAPQRKIDIQPFPSTTATTTIAVNDGHTVYWAGFDPFVPKNTWVFASAVGSDSDVPFSNGTSFHGKFTRTYSAISLMKEASSFITGMAVQRTGNFLFVARGGFNRLSVLNKKTGALIQDITITNPAALCVDANNNLWISYGTNSLSKYSVDGSGNLSSPLLTISSVLKPVALAVSPDNLTLAVADGDTSRQQVFGFNNSTGAPLWTLGTAGGYMHDATVNNNKFYFNDVREVMNANDAQPGFRIFIAYQPDGSFWVNDPGNYRVQHYSANRKFIETIMALGVNYSTWADKNNNTRVGAEYVEFSYDNSAPLTGSSGWKLVKNWGATIPAEYDKTKKFTTVITLTYKGSNHTYGFLRRAAGFDLVELQSNNKLRFTGITKPHCNIDKDGSLLMDNCTKYEFRGFDGLNNPTWSLTPTILANISALTTKGEFKNQWLLNTYITSTGKIIIYDYEVKWSGKPVVYNTGYHLKAIQSGGSNYLWQTAKATSVNYTGPFPDPSRYDIGNKVGYSGSSAMVSGRNIITGYHGEFWKNAQTNMYNHYLDNGLAIGQFGTTGPEATGQAPPMMAGNALSPQLVKGASSDQLYLWHGDEGYHMGLHLWQINGINSIKDTAVPITYPSPALEEKSIGMDLMAGLTDSILVDGSFGWHRNPTTEDYTNRHVKYWTVSIGNKSYDHNRSSDVFAFYRQSLGTYTVTRDLGTNISLSSWSLSGILNWEGNYGNNQDGSGGSYIEILDNSEKVITRLYNIETYTNKNNHMLNIYGNNVLLLKGPVAKVQAAATVTAQPFEIYAINGNITFKYGKYSGTTKQLTNPTANWRSPATLRLYFWTKSPGLNFSRMIDLQAARFMPNKASQTISFANISEKHPGKAPITLIATSSSNLPVTFTVVSGPAKVSANMLTITGTGTIVVKATQPGNSVYSAAAPVSQTFTP